MKTRILRAAVEFTTQPFARPLQLSSGVITEITEARARVRVRVGDTEAEGRGSIYLSDLWAWPGGALDHRAKDAAMRALCETFAGNLRDCCAGEESHPLELGMRLHEHAGGMTSEVPLLARAVCASPFDAAVHDAAGVALGVSAFDLFTEDFAAPSADALFAGRSAAAAIRKIIRPPQLRLPAWWVVSAREDDLRETVRPAVEKSGYACFKVKVLGKDNARDAERVAEIHRAALSWGIARPRICVDSNEANPDAAAVADFLDRLEQHDRGAFAALEYLEQPTARDIEAAPFDWRDTAARKPVLLDEGLTGTGLLETAREQGWSGFALKTCKGHSFALVCAAWARENDLLISLQDLTNPGCSAVHAALFASQIKTINGVELNSPQFTPAANVACSEDAEGIFAPRDGVHILPSKTPPGLGTNLCGV